MDLVQIRKLDQRPNYLFVFSFTYFWLLSKNKTNTNIVLILESQDSHSVAGQVALNKKQGVSGQSVSVSNNINIDKVSRERTADYLAIYRGLCRSRKISTQEP